MSERLFVWNANANREWPFDNSGGWTRPWTVSKGRPEDVADFIDIFETLIEAHSYATMHAARRVAA